MFKIDATYKIKTHIGIDYFSLIDPKKETITVKPMDNHINCETTEKILGYRYPFKMDALVWTNSMCNKLSRLYRDWGKRAGTDTIEFIFH